jgi:hypothetical protein
MTRVGWWALAAACALVLVVPSAGAARGASLELSPTAYSYGAVVIGKSHTAFFLLTNHGPGKTAALTDSLTGPGVLTVTRDTCAGRALAAGDQCLVDVRFAPASSDPVAATLELDSGADAITATLSGQGMAPAALSISPVSHDFGTLQGGQTSAPETFTVTNTGDQSTKPVSSSINGPFAADFSQSASTCGAALKGGASCTISVTFTAPNGSGPESASLGVSSAVGGSASAGLTGSGPCLLHQDGYGQTYLSCQPLGTPGNPATYTQVMAVSAAHAYDASASVSSATCGGASVIYIDNGSTAVVWQYAGTLAGRTERTPGGGGPTCPTAASATWN